MEGIGGGVALVEVPFAGEAGHVQEGPLYGEAAQGDLVRHQNQRAHLR